LALLRVLARPNALASLSVDLMTVERDMKIRLPGCFALAESAEGFLSVEIFTTL
jgi:hypothetical protein